VSGSVGPACPLAPSLASYFVCSLRSILRTPRSLRLFGSVSVHLINCSGLRLRLFASRPALLNHIACSVYFEIGSYGRPKSE